MPVTVPGALKSALGLETTTLCTLWEITRRDGVQYFFTDHDEDILFGGNLYKVGVGYNRNSVEDKSDLSVDETNVQGIINITDVSQEDVRGQRFDGAEVVLRLVDYTALSLGSVIRRRGWFGELKQNAQGEFDVELRGLSQALSEALTKPYTPGCPVDLGSSLCKVPLAGATARVDGAYVSKGTFFSVPGVDDLVFQTQTGGRFDEDTGFDIDAYVYASPGEVFVGEGTLRVKAFRKFFWSFTVQAVTNQRTFEIVGAEEPVLAGDSTYFDGGVVSFLTGNNNAIANEVSTYTVTTGGEGEVSTYLRFPFTIQPGDTGVIYPACNKTVAICKSRFNNVINFQGFPHIPGDKYLKDYPDAK